jgi:hypothetical protein
MAEAKLESLANELLLDIFEHLTAVNLLDAFHHLNSRFDTLLFIYFHGYNLDFRFISKQKFILFIQQTLPLIINQITLFLKHLRLIE